MCLLDDIVCAQAKWDIYSHKNLCENVHESVVCMGKHCNQPKSLSAW